MQLNKGKYIAYIKAPLFQVLEVSIDMKNHRLPLTIVTPHDLHEMLMRERKAGTPEYVAIDYMIVMVYPIPDRRYRGRIVGTEITER